MILLTRSDSIDSQIGCSRDTSFEEMVKKETNGKGVDLVLNSLAEEKLQASVRCLGNNGRFLEIGKFDIVNDSALGMYIFLKEASFHGVMMDFLFDRGSVVRKVSLTTCEFPEFIMGNTFRN
jgi:fatty acid synthase, animal type